MTQTLTTVRLREIASGDAFICTQDDESVAMARELLANREAQPVAYIGAQMLEDLTDGARGCGRVWASHKDVLSGDGRLALYTAPPAPAVPDISALTDLIVDRLIDCSAADDDSIADAETFVYNACRAAMLAQPVSQGYKLPDNVREALTLALQAMEFMGDTLNNIDAVCTEDVEYVTPAFTAVRRLLAAVPEGNQDEIPKR